MRNKLFNALTASCFTATVILFIGWLFTNDLSGWYWFSTFIASIFFNEFTD